MVILVSVAHTIAMITGGISGLAGLSLLRLKFISRSWFNLDAVWAASLALVGMISFAFSLRGGL
jgi:hypothetical protein